MNQEDFYQKLRKDAAKDPNVLLSRLSRADQQKIRSILNDPEQTRRILDSAEAKNLLKKLKKDGK